MGGGSGGEGPGVGPGGGGGDGEISKPQLMLPELLEGHYLGHPSSIHHSSSDSLANLA